MIFFQSIESLQKLLREARGSVTFKVEAKLKIKELENILFFSNFLFLKLFLQQIHARFICSICGYLLAFLKTQKKQLKIILTIEKCPFHGIPVDMTSEQ